MGLPSGTVTFILTDVEGSTVLWDEHPEAMRNAMARHHQIVHNAIETHGGGRPQDQGEGDSVVGAFARATDAVACALDVQRGLAAEPWPDPARIMIRASVHTGEVELREDRNYFGIAINRGARLRAIAHGGQTLVSQATRDLVGDRVPNGGHFKDLGPHRLKDLAVPENVYQLCHNDLPDDFPPLRSLDALPNNLPVQLTLLVGRERELVEVGKLVTTNRLVTLTGAGGCGKTRLALQAAAEVLEDYSDGVWFVDLAAISDPELVPLGMANAFGLRSESGTAVESSLAGSSAARPENLVQRLTDYIRWRSMLVVVDNCEHLVSACAELIDTLLRACPNMKVLATTREPLGVSGEATYRVPSLSVPDLKHLPSLEGMSEFEAVRLFLDRACLVQNEFGLTAENARAVAQICRRLDGIPLAIELAAARVKALTPEQIAARLDDQFRLLTGGARTSLERQQTLRAAVDWSFRLLRDQERRLLARLSVFLGGFTLEAAEEVCADEAIAGNEVLDLLGQLVDKSLVIRETEGTAARFTQLETIRQYAREKLMESGEGESVRTRHRDFYLALAERAEPHLEGREFAKWLDILVRENDNLRAALEWSLSDSNPEPGLRIAGALSHFWDVRGDSSEAFRWLEPLLSREGPTDPKVRAKAIRHASFLTARRGDLDGSRRLLEEAVALAREAGDKSGLARALHGMGMLVFVEGDPQQSNALWEESLLLARESQDSYAEGRAQSWLGSFAQVQGDHQEARRRFEESLAIARSIGSPVGIVGSLNSLAGLADQEGDFETARRLLEEALDRARDSDDTAATWFILAGLTQLAEIRGESSVAKEHWEEASRIVREAGDVFWLHNLGYMAGERGDYETSLSLFHECLARYRELGAADGVAFELNNAGWLTYLKGDPAAARPLLEESVSIHRSGAPRKTLLAASTHSLGEVMRALGDLAGARPLLEESLSLSRELGIKQFAVAALFGLGEIARSEKDFDMAKSQLAEGLRIAQEAVERKYFAEGLERVGSLAVADSDFERAARFFGAAEAMRESMHKPIPPIRVPDYERDVALVRSGLEQGAFEKAWAAGRSMTPDQTLEYALGH